MKRANSSWILANPACQDGLAHNEQETTYGHSFTIEQNGAKCPRDGAFCTRIVSTSYDHET